jgi:ribosomal protein S15P/S13E
MLTDEQKQQIHNDTGAGHALICLVETAATAPLLEHIEELEKDRDYCEQSWNEAMATHENIASLKEQIAALTAQLEEADKDAARYQWLKEYYSPESNPRYMGELDRAFLGDGSGLDAAIDAAIAAQEKPE